MIKINFLFSFCAITAAVTFLLSAYALGASDRHSASLRIITEQQPHCFANQTCLPSRWLDSNLTCNTTCLLHHSYSQSQQTNSLLQNFTGIGFAFSTFISLWLGYRSALCSNVNSLEITHG